MEDSKNEWVDLIGESCRTSDDHRLGHLEAIGTDFIVINGHVKTEHS
jgi:hypothetical protein